VSCVAPTRLLRKLTFPAPLTESSTLTVSWLKVVPGAPGTGEPWSAMTAAMGTSAARQIATGPKHVVSVLAARRV
jgi:hypothetical protein